MSYALAGTAARLHLAEKEWRRHMVLGAVWDLPSPLLPRPEAVRDVPGPLIRGR
ncbi:hypothetical protein [Pyrobaculum ferrireducens]|uniref:Uncharacterized protein n=1 Tax=Pyrobaculum ferrireducens TaxID=1104324 RepID=G7VI32_9CREN|nr:hypothetical protein [Pyrobaculum ferrireducens]AET33392.1 hypothetical protein P186_1996 [Pyrobaculum ferrireducens]